MNPIKKYRMSVYVAIDMVVTVMGNQCIFALKKLLCTVLQYTIVYKCLVPIAYLQSN